MCACWCACSNAEFRCQSDVAFAFFLPKHGDVKKAEIFAACAIIRDPSPADAPGSGYSLFPSPAIKAGVTLPNRTAQGETPPPEDALVCQ